MLKTFMQSSSSAKPKSDAPRASHSAQESARHAESPKPADAVRADYTAARKDAPGDEGSRLIVGPNIKLKGSEITDCGILVVEGRVEASMNSRDIHIAEGGVFSGKAEIDVAEIRGTFEGELTARKRLVIHATGRVSGTIRYGAMQIEEGGIVSGNVAMLPAEPNLVGLPDAIAQDPGPAQPEADTSRTEPIHAGSMYVRSQAGRR